jgi:PAS domain S-box-containing protein
MSISEIAGKIRDKHAESMESETVKLLRRVEAPFLANWTPACISKYTNEFLEVVIGGNCMQLHDDRFRTLREERSQGRPVTLNENDLVLLYAVQKQVFIKLAAAEMPDSNVLLKEMEQLDECYWEIQKLARHSATGFETEYQESELRFQRLIEAAFEGLCISEKGKIVDANQVFLKMYGYDNAEVSGMPIFSFIHEDDRPLVQKNQEENYDKPYTVRGLRKDGSSFSVEVHGKTIPFHGSHARVTSFRDITERKKAEEAIKQSEKYFNLSLDLLCIAGTDGFLKKVNPAFEKVLGYSQDELLNSLFIERVHPDDVSQTLSQLRSLSDGQETINFENRYRCRDNTYKWLSWSASSQAGTGFFYAAAHDITDIKKARERIERSETQLAEAQKMAHIGNWEYDLQSGELYWSDEVYRIMGLEKEKFRPSFRNFLGLVHPEDLVKVKQFMKASTASTYSMDFRIITPDTKMKYVNGQGYTVYKNNQPLRYISTIQDITQHKLIQNELEQAKELAEQSVKVKEQFLANMSHEIRTPLNGIMGFARLLEDTSLSREQQEYVRVLRTSGDNLLHIINDILDLSKIASGKIEFEEISFVMRDVVNSAFVLMKSKADEKGLSFHHSIDKKIPDSVVGDPLRLNQILLNLISNSIKFTEDGRVDVQVKLLAEDRKTAVLGFTVKDTGIGIPQDKIGTIFESFTQASTNTTRKYGGTGLGLTISKQLIELQGGVIEVSSEEGVGTTFTFSLKFSKTSAHVRESTGTPAQPQDSINTRQLHILLAEDNPINQLLTKTVLGKWGFKLDMVENGLQVIEMMKKNNYDLVLMDLQMPEMDGYETTTYIRNKLGNKKIPIIAMTADAMKGEAEKCMSAGMNNFISKPFEPEVLYYMIIGCIGAPALS